MPCATDIKKGLVTEQSFNTVSARAHALVAQQYNIFNDELMPALKEAGIDIVSGNQRNNNQQKWVAQYFEANVKPLLLPIALDPCASFSLSGQ